MNTVNGINSESQQRMNRALIIDLLRKEGVCSRARLAELSGLRPSTVSNIISGFIDCELVVETGLLTGEKNRRSIGIKLNGKNFRVIGVMLTRRHYRLISMGITGEIYNIEQYRIKENEQVNEIIAGIKRAINKMIESLKKHETLAIGISMPGPFRRDKGDMVFVSNLTGWDGVHIYKELQDAFYIPVFIENDANAGAFALLWSCKLKKNVNLIYIVAGQGIGCGVVVGGKILSGEYGLAGEIGHTSIKFDGNQCECGNIGCLETYCSSISLEKKLLECIRNNEKTILKEDYKWEDFVQAVNKNDHVAMREYKAACDFLALGIINLINQFNPGLVVIGDQLAKVKPELMLEMVINRTKSAISPLFLDGLKIEIDDSNIDPIIIGAAAIAAQKVLDDPFEYINQNSLAVFKKQ